MQPKTKTHEAYEYIRSYQGLTKPDSLVFHRWLNDAEKLVNTDAQNAYVLKAFAYILIGQPTNALYAMQNAERLGYTSATQNTMNILHSMGRFDESDDMAQAILQKNPHNAESVQILLFHALSNLNNDKIKNLMKYYSDDNQEIVQKFQEYDAEINRRVNWLNELNIPKETFVNVLQHIYKFLSNKYVGDVNLSIDFGYTDVSGYAQINIFPNNLTSDDCLKLQDEFLDMLIDGDLKYQDYKNILVNFLPECALGVA